MIIESNERTILTMMDPENIAKLLMESNVIDEYDFNQIMLPSPKVEKNKILVGMILTRGSDVFETYIDALYESRTDNHTELAKILQRDTDSSVPHRAEEMLQQSRDSRINKKLENHEDRLRALEQSDSEIKRLRADLEQKNEEIKKLKEQLEAQGVENDFLKKRIKELEAEVRNLKEQLKKQENINKKLLEQQTIDTERINQLENRNTTTESKLDAIIRRMDSMETSKSNAAVGVNFKRATQPTIASMNRFQRQEQAAKARAADRDRRVKAQQNPSTSKGPLPPINKGQKKK